MERWNVTAAGARALIGNQEPKSANRNRSRNRPPGLRAQRSEETLVHGAGAAKDSRSGLRSGSGCGFGSGSGFGPRFLAPAPVSGHPQSPFVISDHLGYPEMVTDTIGAPVWTADHLPFGETVSETGTNNDPLLRYPGQWAVPRAEELNLPTLYYNTYRWYRPQWGRYTQADPMAVKGLPNRYLYGQANSLRYTDVLGLLACDRWDVIGESSKHNVPELRREVWSRPVVVMLVEFIERPLTPSDAGGYMCCPKRWFDYYMVRSRAAIRRCDCSDEARGLGNRSGYFVFETQDIPNNECCEAVYQFGRRALERKKEGSDFWGQWNMGECHYTNVGQECGNAVEAH